MRKSVVNLFLQRSNFLENFEIIEGLDGIDILYLIKNDQTLLNSIFLIISDENMEYLCGSEAFKILVNFEKLKKIKKTVKISLTAFSDPDTLTEMKNNGSDEIFQKPISLANINSIYDKYLKLDD
jgi:CheY-like chemotaxis protein